MSSTESCWLRQEVVEMCIIIIANSIFVVGWCYSRGTDIKILVFLLLLSSRRNKIKSEEYIFQDQNKKQEIRKQNLNLQ